MYEVCIKLRFNEPCLGGVRQPDPLPNLMSRGADGGVVFAAVWWRSIMERSAKVYNRHQRRVLDILWAPEVDGTPKTYKRYYTESDERDGRVTRCKYHEAFLRGDTVGICALIPDDIPIREFEEILVIAGKYFGISQFGWRKGFGKFSVVLVEKTYGRGGADEGNTTVSKGEPDGRAVAGPASCVPGEGGDDLPSPLQ